MSRRDRAWMRPFLMKESSIMITAENAVLRVKRIRHSRNGAFSVADLTTEFGEFKVKDPLLEQFEEGEYEATVWISEIFLGTYVAYGKAVTEIRARLHDLQVHTEYHRPAPREPIEPDPIDEQEPIRLPKQPDPDQTTQPASDAAAGDRRWDQFKKPRKAKGDSKEMPEAAPVVDSPYDAETLAAIERREPIAIDPSVDRALLRQQLQGLKDRGYRFDSIKKLWIAN